MITLGRLSSWPLLCLSLLWLLPNTCMSQVVGQASAPGHPAVAASAIDQDAQRLQKVIEALAQGGSDYGDVEPRLADLIRKSIMVRRALPRMGRLESVDFLREQNGEHIYETWFANGRIIWGIHSTPSGQINRLRCAFLEHR